MTGSDRPCTGSPTARLRGLLADGGVAVGTFVKLGSTEVIDLVAATGFDFVVVDLEHSQLSEAEARAMVRHAAVVGFPAVVRIPEVARGQLNRLLEAGAAGIQLSMLTRRRQVDELVALTRYPPAGSRSTSLGHPAAGYGARPLPAYLDEVSGGPVLVGQIETADAHDPLDELVAGLDVAFCGLTDLAVDLGTPDDLCSPAVAARVGDVARATAARGSEGTFLGSFVSSPGTRELARRVGARYLVTSSDLAVLAGGLAAACTTTREDSFPVERQL